MKAICNQKEMVEERRKVMKTIKARSVSVLVIGMLVVLLTLSMAAFPPRSIGQEPSLEELQQRVRQLWESASSELQEAARGVGAEVAEGVAAVAAAGLLPQLITELQNAGNTWTEQLRTRVESIANMAGVTLDELIPSVSGCIDISQEPVYGALVWAFQRDLAVPMIGITGQGTIERYPGNWAAFGTGWPPTLLPVSDAMVPTEYLQTFNDPNTSCYCIAVPPGVCATFFSTLDTVLRGGPVGRTGVDLTIYVVPNIPGHEAIPVGKRVDIPSGIVRSMEHTLDLSPSGTRPRTEVR